MNLRFVFQIFLIATFASSCIGDDIIEDQIDPVVRILNPVDSIEINTNYSYNAAAFDQTGTRLNSPSLIWLSSDTNIISVDSVNGIAKAKALGTAMIEVQWQNNDQEYSDQNIVAVGNTTVQQASNRMGSLTTTSSYTLSGDFELEEVTGVLELSFASNYRASSSLPGLFVYLTNNPATTNGALEIGPAISFSGAHSYTLPTGTQIQDYQYVLFFCKPFNVKVGDGKFNN